MKGFLAFFCRLSYCYCCSLSDTLCQTDGGGVGWGGTREPAGWIRTNEGRGGTTQVISEYEWIPRTLLMPQCQNCPGGGSLEQPPFPPTQDNPPSFPPSLQDHISVFWCLLFVTEGQMTPPFQPRPACVPPLLSLS